MWNSRQYCISEDSSWTVCMLLCSWTCSRKFCVIPVSSIQLQTVQFVQNRYSKCSVMLCSWTWQALCVSVNSNLQQCTFTVWLFVKENYKNSFIHFIIYFVCLYVIPLEITIKFSWNFMFWCVQTFFSSFKFFFILSQAQTVPKPRHKFAALCSWKC
jgi:hypothetical protein